MIGIHTTMTNYLYNSSNNNYNMKIKNKNEF